MNRACRRLRVLLLVGAEAEGDLGPPCVSARGQKQGECRGVGHGLCGVQERRCLLSECTCS